MKTFDYTLGDRVICCRSETFCSEESHEIFPSGRFKLTTLVGCYRGRNAESRNPLSQECFCNRFGSNCFEGYCFDPSGEPINTCEEISVTLRGRQRTYNVDVDLIKPLSRGKKRTWRSFDMAVNFTALTGDACPYPLLNVLVYVGPYKSTCDK